ncbi:MAG: hypothetical protein ACT452_02810 [Microthrixaceae bacterium]
MTKPRNDRVDAEFYADPANQVPAGPAQRRKAPRRPLTGHVPVRFDDTTIAGVKERAEEDGMTVSAWIRRVVARELSPTEATPGRASNAVVVRVPAGTRRLAVEIGDPPTLPLKSGRSRPH